MLFRSGQHDRDQRGDNQPAGGRRGGGESGERPVVPRAQVDSYYGRPIIKQTVWGAPAVPGYLFLGGLAGASSVLAGFAQLTGNRELSRVAKAGAAGAIALSAAALVEDLGRPERFLNMLRVLKVTSPMSVGSWLLSAYGPAAGAAAACAVTGRFPRVGAAATIGAATVGPGICTYTAALLCDTAVPAWHEGYREMPYLFAGSAAAAAGGLGMLAVPTTHAGQAIRFAVLGAATELIAKSLLLRRLGDIAEPYQAGRAGRLMEAGEVLTAAVKATRSISNSKIISYLHSGVSISTVLGMVRFNSLGYNVGTAIDMQWQHGRSVQVIPVGAAGTSTVEFPKPTWGCATCG